MKKRAASFLLATLAVVSLVLPALAAAAADPLPVEELETPGAEASPEIIEEVQSAIRLDDEPVLTVDYEMRGGVCYVAVSSFVSMMDAEAMVEEEGGVVRVNASTVVEVVEAPAEAEAAGLETDSVETANVVTDDLNLTAAAGEHYFVANDRYLYAADGLIELNGCVAAPIRLMAKVFNLSVDFDAENEVVQLAHQPDAQPYLASGDEVYDSDALTWLARIINAEGGNQPLEGKIAVGNVVMNRVNHPRFPNTVYDVLFQKNQFTPAATGSIYREPNEESVAAAKMVLDGAQVMPTALFFNQAGVACYASRTRTYVATIGSHAFYD